MTANHIENPARRRAYRALERILARRTGGLLSLEELGDTPVLMNTLDHLQGVFEGAGEELTKSEIVDIVATGGDCIDEMLAEAGFPLD